MVRQLIKRKFGVDFPPPGVGKFLHQMGLSPQQSLVRTYEPDPERVRRWKEEEYPAIYAEAEPVGTSIFFAHEYQCADRIPLRHHGGVGGRTPVVTGTGNRMSMNDSDLSYVHP